MKNQMRSIFEENIIFVIIISVLLFSGGCETLDAINDSINASANTSTKQQSEPIPDFYPKVSEDADTIYNLHSNIEKTTFYIDSKKMATGRRIKVALSGKKSYTVVADPEGYNPKEEFIQPT